MGRQVWKTKTHQGSQQFKEGIQINQTLSALERCICCLAENSRLAQRNTASAKPAAPARPARNTAKDTALPTSRARSAPRTRSASRTRGSSRADSTTSATKKQAAAKGGELCWAPYRDSVITMLLRQSLGGNCRTVMICTCATDSDQLRETMGTLRFAERSSHVEVDPRYVGMLMRHLYLTCAQACGETFCAYRRMLQSARGVLSELMEEIGRVERSLRMASSRQSTHLIERHRTRLNTLRARLAGLQEGQSAGPVDRAAGFAGH